jgi:hypothetical protein
MLSLVTALSGVTLAQPYMPQPCQKVGHRVGDFELEVRWTNSS